MMPHTMLRSLEELSPGDLALRLGVLKVRDAEGWLRERAEGWLRRQREVGFPRDLYALLPDAGADALHLARQALGAARAAA